MERRKFYTAGYRRLKFDIFVKMILSRNLTVIDCRHYPFTGNDWNYYNLTHELGTNYLHVKELGNKQFREGVLSVNDLESGIAVLEKLGRPFVLLCACPVLKRCHRSLIVTALESRGWILEDFAISPVQEKKAVQLKLF
jgi:hypothetical protein